MGRKHEKIRPAILIAMLALLLIVIYSGLRVIDLAFSPTAEESLPTSSSKTITVDGVDYFPRQDITVLMLMGIDQKGPVESSDSYNNTGESDVVALAVFDETARSYCVVMLNRDTMMEIPVLGIGGKPAGTIEGQLALAHTYGSGLEDSCENTKEAVSKFFGGLNIDYYLSMNMDAIALLTDAVGGVRVTVTDDFSAVDPTIPMGETVLTGEQALSFIQTRKGVGTQMNVSRMERHESYMQGFLSSLKVKLEESDTFALQTYDAIAEYVVSDCSATTLNSLVNRYTEYAFTEIITPTGENVKGDTYMEFRVDEAALQELMLQLFYSEK